MRFLRLFTCLQVVPLRISVAIARVAYACALTLLLSTGVSAQNTSNEAQSLAAWDKAVTVLQHPRCLNCHQLESPLQGDSRREHIPHVLRGTDNHGVGAMRCGNCHNDMGNNATSRTPGGPHWQLAPASMLWQGLSGGDLCRVLKDPARNGKRSGAQLVEHMETEPLVLWGWNPGPGREPVPMAHREFVDTFKAWVAGGMACPK